MISLCKGIGFRSLLLLLCMMLYPIFTYKNSDNVDNLKHFDKTLVTLNI